MFGHFGRNLAPGGEGDSNPGPLGTKSRVLDHSAPGGHSPGESSPRGIIPLGNHPPGESSPWGIVPLGNHPLGNRPPAQFNSNCYWKFRVTPNDWPSQRPNVLPTPLRKPPRKWYQPVPAGYQPAGTSWYQLGTSWVPAACQLVLFGCQLVPAKLHKQNVPPPATQT